MKDRDIRRYNMFGRVENFGKKNAADFAPESEGGKRFAAIGQIVRDLDRAKAGQQPGHATVKDVLIDALRHDVQDIVRTADAVALDDPGFADSFQLPKNHKQAELLTTVDAMLQELIKPEVAAKFIDHAMPADFVQRLTADREAIANAQDVMENNNHSGLHSTAAIARLIRAGMKQVKYLDAIVQNTYGRNPEQLRVWLSTSAIERPARRKKKEVSGPTSAVPAVPAA